MTEMEDTDRIQRCPIGPPTRSMQNCDFGRTLFKGMSEAPPSKTALCCVNSKECISYKSFIAKAEHTARHLLRHGCRKGDVIALYAPNSIDWLMVVAASFRIGLVPAGINCAHEAAEVSRQLQTCGANFLFTRCGQHLETALQSVAGTKVHTLLYVGDDGELKDGSGNNSENVSGNVLGSDSDNTKGKDNRQKVVNENGNKSGSGKRSGYDDGIAVEKRFRYERGNAIGKENKNEIEKEHENAIGKEHEKKIGKEHKTELGISKSHQNEIRFSKGREHVTDIVSGNHGDSSAICVPSIDSVDQSQLLLPEFDELQLEPQDVAMLMLSSGTTGPPKAIRLSHLNLQAQFIIASDERVMKVTDGQIVHAPFSHLGGGVMTLFALALGFTTHIMTSFQLEPYLKTLSENKNKSIAIVPAIALSLVKATEEFKYDLSNIREILSGTARLSSQVERQLSTRFPGSSVRQGYGLTETTAICTCVPRNLPPDFARSKSGSIGVPLYNVELKVVDLQSGVSLGSMQNGELLVRSPLVMKGYVDSEDVVVSSSVIDDEGWLHTGDMGCYDDDGYLWFADRIKDLMICSSHQVSPSELESVLLTHRDVADAAVFALHDGSSGDDLPSAWVVRKQGARVTEEELDLHVSNLVASHKRLRGGIRFVEAIPRTTNGKILRPKIQQLATALSTQT